MEPGRCHAVGVSFGAEAVSTAAVGVLGSLLAVVTLLGGFAANRLHGAYREALRELRDGERRLDPEFMPAAGSGQRLLSELRWFAELRDAGRDARWRPAAASMAVLSAVIVLLGGWILLANQWPDPLDGVAVVALVLAAVLVTLLLVADGSRLDSRLARASARSPLAPLVRVEEALAAVRTAGSRSGDAHRAYLRAAAATGWPGRLLARWRWWTFARADDRHYAAVRRLRRSGDGPAVVEALGSTTLGLPPGYADGLAGVLPLLAGYQPQPGDRIRVQLDDSAWAAVLADLERAAELDGPRRLRWLSALAACAEARQDEAAQESAARWTLAAATAQQSGPVLPGGRGWSGPRVDPLPDGVVIGPSRPPTFSGAVRRGRGLGTPDRLLADLLVRWAYALAAEQRDARGQRPGAGGRRGGRDRRDRPRGSGSRRLPDRRPARPRAAGGDERPARAAGAPAAANIRSTGLTVSAGGRTNQEHQHRLPGPVQAGGLLGRGDRLRRGSGRSRTSRTIRRRCSSRRTGRRRCCSSRSRIRRPGPTGCTST